jgi:hypothetical protein
MQAPSKSQCHSSCNRKVNPKTHLEILKTPNSQSNAEQKEQSCKNDNTRLHIVLQKHSIKNTMVPAKKKMWVNRPELNKSIQLQPSDFQKRCQKQILENRQLVQQMISEKLDFHM